MFLKLSFLCVLIFSFPPKSEEVPVPGTGIPKPLSKAEWRIVEHIVSGDYVLARKSILKLDPKLGNCERLRFIFKSVYVDTFESFRQLESFAHDSKNPVITFNAMLVLSDILNTDRFHNEPDIDIEKEFIGSSLVDVTSEILERAILSNDLREDHINLVMKNLLNLGENFYNQIITKISDKLAGKHGDILKKMSTFFNQIDSNRTDVARARFDYFHQISNALTYSAIEGSEKYQMIIQKGRYVIQALGNRFLKISQPENINSSAPIFWNFEHINGDLFYVRKRGESGSYLCAEEDGNYLKLHFKEQKCMWEVYLKENRFFFYNMAAKKYLCAIVNELESAMYFSSKEEVDHSFVSADRCSWEIKHWIED